MNAVVRILFFLVGAALLAALQTGFVASVCGLFGSFPHVDFFIGYGLAMWSALFFSILEKDARYSREAEND